MLEELRQQVCTANQLLVQRNLAILTWGNVSARHDNYIIIKPSGVDYRTLKPEDMVILDLQGQIIEGSLRPSSDTPTHLELYRAFPDINGICHTHSRYATSFAQAGQEIVPLGTTHADYFCGNIPCTRILTAAETQQNYEQNTGKVIIERFANVDYLAQPGVLVKAHGVFSWGQSPLEAVDNAAVIEELACLNYQTLMINPATPALPGHILHKHYLRKHGTNAYYGQTKR